MQMLLRGVLVSGLLAVQVTGCYGADVNRVEPSDYFNDPGALALAESACRGSSGDVDNLVKEGQSPNVVGRGGFTPLFVAISCQSEAGVKALLESGADADARADIGVNPVWVAAGWESTEILKMLLEHGGDMHVADKSGETPLIRSLDPFLSKSNFRLLVARGVDVNQASHLGRTAAQHAVAVGSLDLVVELLEVGYSYDLLGLAVSVEGRAVSDNQVQYLRKVRSVLADKGLKKPLPALVNESGRIAYMTANPAYAAEHPESWPIGHRLHPGAPYRTPGK